MLGVLLLVVIGSVTFTMAQLDLAPVVQKRTEAHHYTTVEGNFQHVFQAVQSAGHGTASSATIQMGATYPRYLFLIQPPGPEGTLTTANSSSRLSLTTKRGNGLHSPVSGVDSMLQHQNRKLQYSTVHLRYQPSYIRFQPPPVMTVTGATASTTYEGGTTVLGGQTVVSGREISLRAMNGSIALGQRDPLLIQTSPLSASTQKIPINGNGNSLQLTLWSRLSKKTWKTILAQQYSHPSTSPCSYRGGTQDVCNITKPDANHVTLTFKHGTQNNSLNYYVSSALVGVRTVHQARLAASPPADYMVHVSPKSQSVPKKGQTNLVVQVRDNFSNPYAGEKVHAKIRGGNGHFGSSSSSITSEAKITQQQGRVTFRYNAPDRNTTAHVLVWFGNSQYGPTPQRKKVTFTVKVQ